MLDVKLLRNEIESVAERLLIKGFKLDIEKFNDLESRRKSLQVTVEDLKNQRNVKSKAIGKAKAAGDDVEAILAEVSKVGEQLGNVEGELQTLQSQLETFLSEIPNIPHESVPAGVSEDDNEELRRWGEPREFSFEVRDHVDVGEGIKLLDFDSAAKIAGSRFAVLKQDLARMHRALIQFMLDTHSESHGYDEVYVPYLVNSASLYGTGQLPKFEADLFKVNDERTLYLIPTGEVPVTNLVRDEIIAVKDLPLKYVSHTPCFRSEAGSYGRDTRGMIRQHQFEKVELVQVVEADQSYQALEQLLGHAETILQKLELPYRVVTLCGGDLGFSSAKTYDIEVWLPGQGKYREISSCSNFEDFQARRLKARCRKPEVKKPELVHTVNGSGLAIGRTLVAILENYQQEDGSVVVPEVLHPYMGGKTVLKENRD
ncbi:MAG: serine--tRNA ligase [Moraxellaceae bacterium]|nr:MAG: serine--tRNA ligase [Moraxellaceae bacterium]